jgi:Kef-type K+ transport system membrane component KefB/voltage-gated potassium channel Kch
MMDANEIGASLLPVILVLAMGLAASLVSRELRLNPIVGLLVLGTAIGTFRPSLLSSGSTAHLLAELGVVFLLFDIGLHFSLSHVREQAGDIFGFGPVQILCATLLLSVGGLLLGLSVGTALLVGATLALSSTAVVSGVIAERHQQNCPVGLTATAILIFQDVAAIFLLIMATGLQSGGAASALLVAFVKAALATALAVAAARLVVRPLFAVLARRGGQEVFTAIALLVALSAGWAAATSGLSMTLGAFLGGMAVAETPFRAVIRSEINPFRQLLLGFFFIAVGASLDMKAIVDAWPAVLAIAAALFACKIAGNAAASLAFRWSVPGSIQLAFLIAQGSEFAFVMFGLPGVRKLIGNEVASVLIAAVALSLAVTPSVATAGRRLAGWLRARAQRLDYLELVKKHQTEPVLIVGMGETGRTVADALTEFGIGYAALERDPARLRESLADGYKVFFGDAADPRLWRAIELEHRRFNLLTDADPETARELATTARTFYPGVERLAVVDNEGTADRFRQAGVTPIIERSEPKGLDTARFVLDGFGVSVDAIEQWVRQQRERSVSGPALMVSP